MAFSRWHSPLSGGKQESCRSVKPFFLASAATAWAWSRLGNCQFSATARSSGCSCVLVLPSVVAYMLGRLLFHGRGLAGAYFAIVTLCAAVIVETLAQQWSFIGGFNGLLGIPPSVAPWRTEPMPISAPPRSTSSCCGSLFGISWLIVYHSVTDRNSAGCNPRQ